jgi:hypothetical protein
MYRPLICPTGQVLIFGTLRKFGGSEQTRMVTARGQSAAHTALPWIIELVAQYHGQHWLPTSRPCEMRQQNSND